MCIGQAAPGQSPVYYIGKMILMRSKFSTVLAVLALLGALPLLGGCHTAAGAGQDITDTGHAITHSADKNMP